MFLFESKYITGKIPQVLNINKQTNRATCLLVHVLYIAIHFITTSNIVKISTIIIRESHSKPEIEFNGIVVINIFY